MYNVLYIKKNLKKIGYGNFRSTPAGAKNVFQMDEKIYSCETNFVPLGI